MTKGPWTESELENLKDGINAKETIPGIHRHYVKSRSPDSIKIKLHRLGWRTKSKLRWRGMEAQSHMNAECALFSGSRLDISLVLDEQDFAAFERDCKERGAQMAGEIGDMVRRHIATIRWTKGSR